MAHCDYKFVVNPGYGYWSGDLKDTYLAKKL